MYYLVTKATLKRDLRKLRPWFVKLLVTPHFTHRNSQLEAPLESVSIHFLVSTFDDAFSLAPSGPRDKKMFFLKITFDSPRCAPLNWKTKINRFNEGRTSIYIQNSKLHLI